MQEKTKCAFTLILLEFGGPEGSFFFNRRLTDL